MPAELQPYLLGERIELRPLLRSDWEALLAVAADPKIWEQHPNYDRYQETVFRRFFDEALASGGALVAIDRKTGAVIGSSRFVWYDKERREIEIGWTFLSRSYWGGQFNGEMKRLMIRHAFTLSNRVVFVIGPNNRRSRKAIERIGATLTPALEKGTTPEGETIDLVVYEIRREGD